MGLDIIVYSNVKQVGNRSTTNDFTAFVACKTWEHKIKNLVNRGKYKGKAVYHVSISYSGYMYFRKELLRLTGNEQYIENEEIQFRKLPESLPFVSLIDFSDCEGALDYEACEKLYEEFLQWCDKVAKHAAVYPFFSREYNEFFSAFNYARQNGVMVFR